MNRFVHGRAGSRTGSPLPSHPQRPMSAEESAYRRSAAAGLKVDVRNTNTAGGSAREANGQQPGQNASRLPKIAAAQHPRRRGQPQATHEPFYETDPENADLTTTTTFSNGLPENDPAIQQDNIHDPQHDEGYEGQSDGDEESADLQVYGADAESYGQHPREPHATYVPGQEIFYHAQKQLAQGKPVGERQPSLFGANQSYPETSSGIPDDEDEQSEGSVASFEDQNQQYDPAVNVPNTQWQEYQQPVSHPPPYASQPLQDAFANVQRQNAVLKQHPRSDTNLPLRNGGTRTEFPGPQNAGPVDNVQYHQRMNSAQRSETPSKVTQPTRQPAPVSPTVSVAETINARNAFVHGLVARPVPPTPSDDASQLQLDYDDDVLHQMSYSDLEAEPFDEAPRVDRSKLPLAESASDPLDQRLSAAFHELNSDDQTKFFASLTIDQWEEAGDWFLDRFGALVQQMKAARQDKRRAAREFEAEIRQRSDAVARKRRCVVDEIDKMRNKGQRLLPDTPSRRRAATPAFGQR